MSNSKREFKTYDFRVFPMEKLCLDIGKELTESKYGNIHIGTVIYEDDNPYNYSIKFNGVLFHSKSFIYYLDKKENKPEGSTPIFYNYPKIHFNYEKRDETGKVLRIEDDIGKAIETFFENYRLKIEELVNAIAPRLKSQIAGKDANKKADFISKVTAFPKNKYKQEDKDQSPTMKLRLFTVVQKKTNEKEKGPKNTTDDDEEEKGILIPGTNPQVRIRTRAYDKRNTKKPAFLMENYELLKPIIYSSDKHKNASPGGMKEISYTMELASPVLHSGKEGVSLQLTISKFILCTVNSSSYNKGLSLEEENETALLTEQAKKNDDIRDDNDESTVEEFPNDSPPGSQINKRKREDVDDGEEYEDHQIKRQKIE